MAYIGNQAQGSFSTAVKDTFNGTGSQTEYTLSQGAVANNLDVFVNNVRQEPGVAYTCSGNTLTFTAAPASGTGNIYVVNRGPAELTATFPANQSLEANNGTFTGDLTVGGSFTSQGIDDNASSTAVTIDSSGNVGINTNSIHDFGVNNHEFQINGVKGGSVAFSRGTNGATKQWALRTSDDDALRFESGSNYATERMRLDSSGNLLVGKTTTTLTVQGARLDNTGRVHATRSDSYCLYANRLGSDGELVRFQQNSSTEGSISVSGTTVSYNGGHLARWSQLTDGTKDETIVKGTVMTNLDQMSVWSHDAVEAQDVVYDEDGNVVTEAVEAKDAYTEDNEQLNCMAVSSVEGDPNVAGVFVNWDNDDDQFNDMNIAMTGDMVIRIAQGTTVARGDLLMSAGDGTAKPQGDDIVRSKTIAKVTSTNVSHTYGDGSYLVPCVLMAC